jgi:hypothetical protein
MRDGAAQRFQAELKALVSGSPDIEEFDHLLDEYQTLLSQPAVYH